MDVLSASKIVLEMVKRKYLRRVAKVEQQQQQQQQQQPQQHQHQQDSQMEALLAAATAAAAHPMPGRGGFTRGGAAHDPAVSGCPMMDGSLEPYYPLWDETFTNHLVASTFAAPPQAQQQGGVGEGEGAGLADADSAGVPPVGVPNDLWTAMTMGWAQGDANLNFDAL